MCYRMAFSVIVQLLLGFWFYLLALDHRVNIFAKYAIMSTNYCQIIQAVYMSFCLIHVST